MKNSAQIFIIIAFSLSCTNKRSGDNDSINNKCNQEYVSLVRLISVPELFDGCRVVVVGYYVSGFEESHLFLHKQDADKGVIQNSIWISPFAEKEKRKIHKINEYYLFEGIFKSSLHGHRGMVGGFLKDISRAEQWLSPRTLSGLLKNRSSKTP